MEESSYLTHPVLFFKGLEGNLRSTSALVVADSSIRSPYLSYIPDQENRLLRQIYFIGAVTINDCAGELNKIVEMLLVGPDPVEL